MVTNVDNFQKSIASGFVLGPQQTERAAALHQARAVLVARGPMSSTKADAMDLVNVASWIMTGHDPWSEAVEK